MADQDRKKMSLSQSMYKGSDVPFLRSMSFGLLFGVIFLVMVYFAGELPRLIGVREIFFERGFIQFINVALGAWAVAILFLKRRENTFQGKLAERIKRNIPLDQVLDLSAMKSELLKKVPPATKSWLFQRIERIDTYLKAAGSTKGLRETLREQSDRDANAVDVGYSILRVLVAVIPLVGFSGTVLGISASVGHFSGVIQIAKELDEVTRQLGGVTNGLAVAFDTTLISLLITIPLMMMVSALKKRDDEFLNEIDEYTEYYIVDPLQNLDKKEQDFKRLLLQISDESLQNHTKVMMQNNKAMEKIKDQYQQYQQMLDTVANQYFTVGQSMREMAEKQALWTENLKITENVTNNFDTLFSVIKALPEALNRMVSQAQEVQRKELKERLDKLGKTIQTKDTETSVTLQNYLEQDQKTKEQLIRILQQIDHNLAELQKPLEEMNKPVTVTLSRNTMRD